MKKIFINLAVKNLSKSLHFYTQLGFTPYPLFSDDDQKCVIWSEHIYLMLFSMEQFSAYSQKEVSDTQRYVTAYYTLACESLAQVNEIAERGLQAGGTAPIPMLDHGFMQVRRIADLDGYIWDFIFLDMDKFQAHANGG